MMKFKSFQIPMKLVSDDKTMTDSYGKFVAEPFERGYGHTVGNSLRRILLSSLEGAAVTAVKIDGVLHEFSTVPGVVEDVTNIILNLKTLRFNLYKDGSETVMLEAGKKGPVTAKDIKLTENIELLNPSAHICTLDRNMKLNMEIEVSKGRGYLPVEKAAAARQNQPIGLILVDAIFTPVLKVNYEVENARVGQSIDYDRLIMEIWTDSSVKPVDALAYSAKILKDSLAIFINFDDIEPRGGGEKPAGESDEKTEALQTVLAQQVSIIELTVRSVNCLNRAKIRTIGDLVKQSEDRLLAFKNFGKKSLNEIKKKLAELGKSKGIDLSLGMDISGILKKKEEE